MKEIIFDNLMNMESLDITVMLLNNIVALVIAGLIMLIYKITYSGVSYNRKFNVSLGMLTLITTTVMSVISNNVALSLGMVGALSIIRFRTAVKDVRDTCFIFWSIAIGIGCGVSQYILVIIGSAFLLLFLILTHQIVPDNKKILVVRGNSAKREKVEDFITQVFMKDAHQVVKTVSESGYELVYDIAYSKILKVNEKNKNDIISKIMNLDGVTNVNLIDQTDDIGR